MTPLAMGLLGSGEFDPWAEEVDRWLLDRAAAGDGRVLILPTASAPDGDEVFEMWSEKGMAHYERQGIPAEVLPLKTRKDADRADLTAKLDDASMVFFSGGNPAYLAATLVNTGFWRALLAGMDRGLAYAGCSAGVACLPDLAPDSGITSLDEAVWRPGLGFFHEVIFMPHWNALDSFMPGLTDFVIASVPPGSRLFAIEENTAAVGDGYEWSVLGVGKVRLLRDGGWREFYAGQSFTEHLMGGVPGA